MLRLVLLFSAALSASAADFVADPASGGWVVEVESAAPVDPWRLEKEHGEFSGSGYYAWRGPHVKHQPGTAVLSYRIQVPTSGGYQMSIRARRDVEGAQRADDLVNDVFVRLDSGPWIKASHTTPWGQWGEIRRFSYETGLKDAVFTLEAGRAHRFEIAARSDNVKIDRILFALVGGAAGAPTAAAESPVPQWGRFETSIRNERGYTDPYRDVTLDVVYTAPGGKEIRFWGFFDGDRTWRARFMPHVTGRWKYTATFSDGSPGQSGEFRVSHTGLPGMITVNRANPIWFSGDVRPVLVRGLHIGDRFFAANWPAARRTAFLDWAQEQGYNLLSVASHYLSRDTAGRGQGWDTPRLWPLDAAEFREQETLLDELARRRVYVYPFAGFFGRDSGFPREPAEQTVYIRYVLARFAPYWNILLNVSGPEPRLKKKEFLPVADIERLGAEIARLDPFGHLLSVHNQTGDDEFKNASWLNYGTLQGPKTLDRAKLSAGLLRNHHAAKPLLAQETLWPGNKYHPAYTDDDLRKNAYVLQMSAAALVYGDFDGDSSTGFSGTMELADRKQSRHDIAKAVWDFIAEVPYFEMQPRQDLVSQGYCLAWPGRDYLVYLESGGVVDVEIERGPYVVTWINARDTTQRQTAGTTADGRGLRAPDDGDWLVRLTRTGTGLPDQIHLSWQDDPATTITVTWHTATQDNPAEVEYRAADAPDAPWVRQAGETLKSPGDGWLHRATLRNLAPATAYEYRVSSDRGTSPAASHSYVTRTAPAAGAGFTAAFVADTGMIGRIDGNATGTRRVIESVGRDRPDFILGGGDYAYANRDLRFGTVGKTIDEWFHQWEEVIARIPLMAQYGNHEDHLAEKFEDWAARFAHPPGHAESRDYAFMVADVFFVGLYVPKKDIPDSRLAWLDRELASARERGARWLVVYQHEPIYGHGRSHPAYPEVRAKIAPIMERHAVDLHISTHDQNYERTFPLSGVPDADKIRSLELDNYRQGEGTIYAKVSPSGKKSEIGNEFSRFMVAQQPFIAVRESGFHHYALLHLTKEGALKLEVFRLPDEAGEKSLVDSFTIAPRS